MPLHLVTALRDPFLFAVEQRRDLTFAGPFKQERSVLPEQDPFLGKVWESADVSLDQLQLCLPACGHAERYFFFFFSSSYGVQTLLCRPLVRTGMHSTAVQFILIGDWSKV